MSGTSIEKTSTEEWGRVHGAEALKNFESAWEIILSDERCQEELMHCEKCGNSVVVKVQMAERVERSAKSFR